jgi:hypothetical protein
VRPKEPDEPDERRRQQPPPETRRPTEPIARVPITRGDDAPEPVRADFSHRVIDFTREGLESALWRLTESAAASLSPLGPPVVKAAYFLKKQLYDGGRSLLSGDGLALKVAIPQIPVGPTILPPPGFDLVAKVTLGDQHAGAMSAPGLWVDIQFFRSFTDPVDVGQPARPRAERDGVPAAADARDRRPDPFAVLLGLMGDALVIELARTLAEATDRPFDTLQAELRRRARR